MNNVVNNPDLSPEKVDEIISTCNGYPTDQSSYVELDNENIERIKEKEKKSKEEKFRVKEQKESP